MERQQTPGGRGGIDIIFTVSSEGQTKTIDSIRIEGLAARKMNIPSNPCLGKNGNGEMAFYQYSADRGENVFYENTPMIKRIINAILEKVEDIKLN